MKNCTKCKVFSTTSDGQAWCSLCKHNWYSKNKRKHINRVIKRKVKIREWFIEYKKTLKCSKCFEKDWRCLDFHHTTKDKSYNVGTMASSGLSIITIKKEIAKCQVLCSNCHRKETIKY